MEHATHPLIKRLGLGHKKRVALIHADDVAMCHGATVAFVELSRRGAVTCGSVMVPCPGFSEMAAIAANDPSLDVGVHLTLTSEWDTYRWGPVSTTQKSSGLIDGEGCFWRKLPLLAAHCVPEAAEIEMRAQIERALASGIDITHIDTHMGAALLPQLAEIYLRLGEAYRLPVLMPRHMEDYLSVLDFGDIGPDRYSGLHERLEAEGYPLVDHFRMTPGVASSESDDAYRAMIQGLPDGLTFVALHPTAGGEIEEIVPAKAHYRTDEHRILSDPAFAQFINEENIATMGFRPLRDMLRRDTGGREHSVLTTHQT